MDEEQLKKHYKVTYPTKEIEIEMLMTLRRIELLLFNNLKES